MFSLISTLREPTPETPDTGTFADAALSMPMVELTSQRRRDRRSKDHARDYGVERMVQIGAVGYV
ncbi:hypothetical protein [Rhizobium sp. AAP43]|uniref:hypothetical protein n=1 Tax=Rhizobium sp. AAP43 TaxID=1523420 RepID=UPI0006B93F3F|nr:hypothetical protein [Rhizobium sp. AAP43]KPF42992.1 hypothetical protein IP76_14435 [Rhizobium sp. AAP43]